MHNHVSPPRKAKQLRNMLNFFQGDYFYVSSFGPTTELKKNRDRLNLMHRGKMLLKEYLHLDLRKVDTVRWNTQRTGGAQQRQTRKMERKIRS